jgi:hypothetical protein
MEPQIDTEILNRWLQAKCELHSGKISKRELRKIREHEALNQCQYCTNYLTEKLEAIINWNERLHLTTDPCVKCGIRDNNQFFFDTIEKKNRGDM